MMPTSNTLFFLGAMVTGMSAVTLYVQYVEWKGRQVNVLPPQDRDDEEETDPNIIWQLRDILRIRKK